MKARKVCHMIRAISFSEEHTQQQIKLHLIEYCSDVKQRQSMSPYRVYYPLVYYERVVECYGYN